MAEAKPVEAAMDDGRPGPARGWRVRTRLALLLFGLQALMISGVSVVLIGMQQKTLAKERRQSEATFARELRTQERLLRQLEARGDRFQREYEDIGETTPENPFDVTGVPEPEEWLFLALAVGMLGWYIYTTRLKMQPQPNR